MERVFGVLAGLALLLGRVSPAEADLVTNGGFETGDFTGWNVAASATFVIPAPFSGYNAASGNYFAALGNVGGLGTLSQTITDTEGQKYTLSMALSSNGTGPNEFKVQWNETTLFDQTNIPATGASAPYPYTLLSFPVVGTGSDTLTIFEQNVPNYLALDNVSLQPAPVVPEPTTLLIFGLSALAGAAFVGWRQRKRTVTA